MVRAVIREPGAPNPGRRTTRESDAVATGRQRPGPTLIPRPERLYFRFGEPIDTARCGGRHDDDKAVRSLRDEVRAAVQSGLEELLAKRRADPQRSLRRRLTATPVPELAESEPGAYFVMRAFEAWNSVGIEGAAAWMSRWVQLTDDWPASSTSRGRDAVIARLREVTAELGAAWAEVTEARSEGNGGVLVRFALRDAEGRLTYPHAFQARVEVTDDQIVAIEVQVALGGMASVQLR